MKTVQNIYKGGKRFLLLFMDIEEETLLYNPPDWYAAETPDKCEEVYNKKKTESSRGMIYSLENIKDSNLLDVVSSFNPDKIPSSLCGLLPPLKVSEIESIINNNLSKELSLNEI